MGSQQKEYLSSIGWEDSWIFKENFPSVTRVGDPKKITNGVIFALLNKFSQSFLVLYSFVQLLLPVGFDLPPFNTFKNLAKMCRKNMLKKDSKIRNKDLPFFPTVQLSRAPNPPSPDPFATERIRYETRLQDFLNRNQQLSAENGQLVEKIDDLTSRLSKLEAEFQTLRDRNETLQSHLGQVSGTLKGKDVYLTEISNKLASTQKKFATASKTIKGLRQSTFQAKASLCRCSGRDDHDLIFVKSYEAENSSIFEGIFITKDGGPLKHKTTFVNLGRRGKSNSELSQRELRRRSNLCMRVLSFVSGDGKVEEVSMLLMNLLQKIPSLAHIAAEMSGIIKPLSPSDAVQLRCLLRMPTAAFRRLRCVLTNLGAPILPSEPKMRVEQVKLTKHANENTVSVKLVDLFASADDSSCSPTPVLRVTDLKQYVTDVFVDLKTRNHVRFDDFGGDIWIVFGGDKGDFCMEDFED
ncbi:uncharacterized protein LOC130625452 isoform X2 [Hydractinia symbiolongicarpus]|uniref:uncharacterized protein LOC130625452 isoform X2 n=1 Tax=Hydractinia symbiolongicarpus TaxID=13093 RepID=UPI00254A83CE|nr:uncharacterized protein LOC130625452 isoform X2 [Hydractinia symbiolongicarpus]